MYYTQHESALYQETDDVLPDSCLDTKLRNRFISIEIVRHSASLSRDLKIIMYLG